MPRHRGHRSTFTTDAAPPALRRWLAGTWPRQSRDVGPALLTRPIPTASVEHRARQGASTPPRTGCEHMHHPVTGPVGVGGHRTGLPVGDGGDELTVADTGVVRGVRQVQPADSRCRPSQKGRVRMTQLDLVLTASQAGSWAPQGLTVHRSGSNGPVRAPVVGVTVDVTPELAGRFAHGDDEDDRPQRRREARGNSG